MKWILFNRVTFSTDAVDLNVYKPNVFRIDFFFLHLHVSSLLLVAIDLIFCISLSNELEWIKCADIMKIAVERLMQNSSFFRLSIAKRNQRKRFVRYVYKFIDNHFILGIEIRTLKWRAWFFTATLIHSTFQHEIRMKLIKPFETNHSKNCLLI